MSHAQYGQAATKDKVWNSAKTIRGKNPDTHRQDPYGNPIYYGSYGKYTQMGWQVDHIKPVSRNGSNGIRNLQAMQTSTNQSKGNTLKKASRHSK